MFVHVGLVARVVFQGSGVGVVDDRNISKSDWYKSDAGIKQVMKEFINIGEQTISDELSLD